MATVFPNDLDSDLEIPRVDQDVSEISGDVINSLRDAVFAIQQTIGVNPQGNKSSLTARINVSIDADGLIKREALEEHGLLSLPVIDRHIGTSAAIKETKLALDYGTQTLRNLISSLQADVTSITSGITSTSSGFNQHVLGQSYFHDGYHIKINTGASVGIAGLEATTVGDALNEIGALLISGDGTIDPHINSDISSEFKHIASNISVDATDFTVIDRSSRTVQDALDSLDTSSGILGITHVDQFHDNGILKEANSSTNYNPNRLLLGPVSGVTYTEGTSVIQIPGVTSFSSLLVTPGDIVEIETQTGIADTGTYKIRAIGPLTDPETLGDLPTLSVDELAIFHVFTESRVSGDGISVNIYRPSSESTELAPLACAVRNSETITDTISIMNPGAARVVSVGFNSEVLNADGYDITIKAGIGGGRYRELVIPDLNHDRLGTNQASPVSANSVAERINAYVSDPDLGYNFPVSAYCIGNEIAIAHNMVGTAYTIEILDGYTGNFPLGLDAYGANVLGEEIAGNTSSSYVVNGEELTELGTIFSGYASISTTTDSFSLWTSGGQMINPLRYGIGPGSVMHVTGHQTLETNGSYTLLSANSTTVSLFAAETIDAPTNPTTFNVLFTDSNISLSSLESTETDMGIMQIFVDANGNTFSHQRLTYGNSLGPAVEIIDVSGSFPVGDLTLLVTTDGNYINFNLVGDSLSGDTVRIHEDFKGSFKLYHSNGIDYVLVRIIAGSISGGLETISVDYPIASDEAMLLCTAHFNGTLSITNITDDRMFGNLGVSQARDDLVELLSQKPVEDLRSNGVVRGFDLMDIPYLDSVTNMEALPLRGGIAYVNGVRLSVETQKVVVKSYDEEGNVISNARRVVGINDFGSLQVFSDELGEILTDGYISSSTFGKILPLYYITIENGGIDDVIDIRRFINNIDDKLNIIVDESNNVVGNFRDLEGALLYASHYPGGERLVVKIINSVNPQGALVVPHGVSIIGDVPYGNSMHQIINTTELGEPFMTLMGSNRIENIEITSNTAGLQSSLVYVSGNNVNVEQCLLKFGDIISSNSGDLGINIGASNNVRIKNNQIENVYTGISSTSGCSNLEITNNIISGLSGVGISVGIKIGSADRAIDSVRVCDNRISADAVSSTDIRGIFVDVGETISSLSICRNSMTCALNGSSKNYFSNGIRISNVIASGNKVTQLVVTDNYINNVRLQDGFVYGMYLEDISRARVSGNTLHNIAVYDASYSETAGIWVDDSVDTIDIQNNTLIDSEALRGINVKSSDTSVTIVGNTLENIGDTDAVYIYGLAHRANISDNKLIGPGKIGIWWRGERSKISNNHLSTPDPTTDYAFQTGIYAQASYVDVVNNTIVDMTDDSSIGIANANSANEGLKVIGNTIEGTTMAKLINLYGNYHIVSNNRLKNDAEAAGDSLYISLGQNADGISIMGNVFEGIGTACIHSDYQVTNVSITSNLILTTTLTSAPIRLTASGVANCMVSGNKLPAPSTYSDDNAIGVDGSYLVYNTNTIGINRGLPDTRGIHASAGSPGYETAAGADYAGIAHWALKDGNGYWEINDETSSDTRYLYFPINNIPNGATLTSVHVQGNNVVQSGDSFGGQIFKRSVNETGLTVTAVSDEKDFSTASGEFGNGDIYGLINKVNVSDDIEEVINYSESNYFVRIQYTKAYPTTPEDIRIYGLTVNFRY